RTGRSASRSRQRRGVPEPSRGAAFAEMMATPKRETGAGIRPFQAGKVSREGERRSRTPTAASRAHRSVVLCLTERSAGVVTEADCVPVVEPAVALGDICRHALAGSANLIGKV